MKNGNPILISKSKFYRAVTGSTTVNTKTTEAALQRWGIPYLPGVEKGDAVDTEYVPVARKLWEAENAARDARRPAPKANDAAPLFEILSDIAQALRRIESMLHAQMPHDTKARRMTPSQEANEAATRG
jgi:hypothetical protein